MDISLYVGIHNDSIHLIICADKNFIVNGYKIGDIVDCDTSNLIKANNQDYLEVGNGWFTPVNLKDSKIAYFLKYDFEHNNHTNSYNHNDLAFYYNYDADLKLGEKYCGEIITCDSMRLPLSDKKVKSITVYKDGVRYRIGLNNNHIISIIRCDQSIVVGEYINNKPLEYISGNAKISSKYNNYYVYLTDGWWIELEHGNSLCSKGILKYDGWTETNNIIHVPQPWLSFCHDFFTNEFYQKEHIKFPIEIISDDSIKLITSKDYWTPIILNNVHTKITNNNNDDDIKSLEIFNSGTKQILIFKLVYKNEHDLLGNEQIYEQRVWNLIKIEEYSQ